jgi:hypothetical protein
MQHPVVEARTGYRQADPVYRIKKSRKITKPLAAWNTPHQDLNSFDILAHKTAYVICLAEEESIRGDNRSKPVLGNPNLRKETRHHPTSASSCPACSHVCGRR